MTAGLTQRSLLTQLAMTSSRVCSAWHGGYDSTQKSRVQPPLHESYMVYAWVLLEPQRAPPSQHSQMQMLEERTGVRGEWGSKRRRQAVKRKKVRSEETVDTSEEVAIVTHKGGRSLQPRMVDVRMDEEARGAHCGVERMGEQTVLDGNKRSRCSDRRVYDEEG